jgi:hypothetical protein
MSARSRREHMLAIGATLVVMLASTARWFWIGGFGDFGWTYDSAIRIARGEMPHVDYISTLPQLTSIVLAGLICLLGEHPILWSVQLYAWWFLLYFAALALFLRLGLTGRAPLLALGAAIVLAQPANTLGHSYNYASAATFAAALLTQLGDGPRNSIARHLLAGLFAGLAFMFKQNVGAAGFALLLVLAAARPGWRQSLPALAAGAAIPPAIYFGTYAYLGNGLEAARQVLFDASEAKGGLVTILARAMPRLILWPELWHRRAVEIVASCAAIAVSIAIAAKAIKPGTVKTQADDTRLLAALAILYLLMMIFSRQASPALSRLADVASSYLAFGLGVELLYVLVVCSSAVLFLRALSGSVSAKEASAPLLCGTGLLMASATSSVPYMVYALPLWLACAGAAAHALQLMFPWRGVSVCAVGLAMLAHLAPSYAPTFKPLASMPRPLAPYLGAEESTSFYRHIAHDIMPKVEDKATLWLAAGAPYAVFKARNVPAAANWYLDTYNSRSEPRLRRRIEEKPPEFVVLGEYAPAPNADWLNPRRFRQWLAQRYEQVALSRPPSPTRPALELWKLRTEHKP